MAEETNWDYHAGKSAADAPDKNPRAVNWTASEYIDHKQGFGWFASLVLATLLLAGLVYVLTHDYFAVAVIVLVGIIVGIFARRTPKELHYHLSADGLKIEEKLYPLGQFKSFAIIQEGPICNLEFVPLKRFMPPVSAYFETADTKRIIAVLEDFLPYEERRLDGVERLSRRLRF
jgi:hypothetical protein